MLKVIYEIGVFGPMLYGGAMLGAAFAVLLRVYDVDVESYQLALVGMAAIFSGAARVPIASIATLMRSQVGFGRDIPVDGADLDL